LHPQLEQPIDHLGIETILFQAIPLRLLSSPHFHLLRGTRVFFFGHVLPMLCLSAVLYGIGQILRPVASTLFPTEQQYQAVADLIRRYGESSISYFALTNDKSYFFTTSGKGVVSYVLVGNVAVVAGDPLGPPEEITQAIEQFLAFCQKQDWRVVFWQVREQLSACYQAAGLHLLKIGEDAVLSPQTFTLAGKAMANVRTSARRAEKAGIRVVFWRGSVQDAEQRTQMEQISRTWLARKGGKEMGFSMGRFDALGEQESLFALAVDTTNQVHAFVTFVPIYGRHGWALDLMRRSEQACPGVMECLLVQTIAHIRTQGAKMVSLGLAPLNDNNASEQTLLGKGLDALAQNTGHPGQQQALCAFKKKFQPCWESRYLAYSNTLTLPKAGLALYRVHQPDGSLLLACARSFKEWRRRERAVQRHPANVLVP
jgi:phosphatidylglycerol lysyltransferase